MIAATQSACGYSDVKVAVVAVENQGENENNKNSSQARRNSFRRRMEYSGVQEAQYVDPVVRFQDPLFATSDREILVDKIEEAQRCAVSARQECSALQQQLSEMQARYQQLKDKSSAKISELKSSVDRERSRRKQLTEELLADKRRIAQLTKRCNKLKKECLRTIADSEQRVQTMHQSYSHVIERYEQRLHLAAEKIVNREPVVNGHTQLTADIVDYSNDVLEHNRKTADEVSAKQNEVAVLLRRIRSCGEDVSDEAKVMLAHKDHIIELLQQQVHKLQQLSALQFETLARIPHAQLHTTEQQLHQFDSYNTPPLPWPSRLSQHQIQVDSCTSSDP